MTLFGLIWCLLIIICLVTNDIRNMISLTLWSMIFQCNNVVYIGGRGIGPQTITSLIFVLYTIITQKNKLLLKKREHTIIIAAMLLLGTIVIFSSYVNKILGVNIMLVLQLWSYILCFIMLYLNSSSITEYFLYKTIKKIILFTAIIGLIQILITSGALPRFKIFEQLFYNENSAVVYYHIKNYFRLLSTFMEPSYYSAFIVGGFYFLLSVSSNISKNFLLIFIVGIVCILTFSSVAYGTLLITGIIYFLFSEHKDNKIIFLGCSLLVVLILYLFFYNILDSVIFSKAETGSGIKRIGMNAYALRMFSEAPVWGHGYKNFRASSIFYCLLAELGVTGTALYLFIAANIIKPVMTFKRKHTISKFKFAIHMAVICAMTAQLIGCPDLDLCSVWFWIYCLALSYNARSIVCIKNEVL